MTTKISIDPETEMQEAQAMIDFLRNRNLFLAQAARGAIAKIKDLEGQIKALTGPAEGETTNEGEVS